jgi:hypothetical protein
MSSQEKHIIQNSRSKSSMNDSQNIVVSIQDEVIFEGYRNVVRKTVQLPNGQQADFEVIHQKHQSVVVFVWDSRTSTTTLIKEYHPGPDRVLFGTVAGMYEDHKHKSALQAAQYELEEEAQLRSDNWHSLVGETESTVGIPLDKYSNNNFFYYLALDCQSVFDPKPMDAEEYIEVEGNVSYTRLMKIMQSGDMNVVSSFAILLGLNKLTELGIPLQVKSSDSDNQCN